jgi:undecaprenyl diphosphate synthase
MNNPARIPQHVAIIMDGNGRWARARALPKIAGHRAGVKSAREVIKAAGELGIKALTLYTFSTENWKRPRKEVEALFGLLEEYLDKEMDTLNKNNIRFNVIGDMEALPEGVRKKIEKAIEITKDNTGLVLNLALNYGSRDEIINAVRRISEDVRDAKVSPGDIDEKLFSGYLYTAGQPDPDLLIRTSGEFRISNFLLWQLSYAELYITKKLWPDFGKDDLKKAVAEYGRRERRFGG